MSNKKAPRRSARLATQARAAVAPAAGHTPTDPITQERDRVEAEEANARKWSRCILITIINFCTVAAAVCIVGLIYIATII